MNNEQRDSNQNNNSSYLRVSSLTAAQRDSNPNNNSSYLRVSSLTATQRDSNPNTNSNFQRMSSLTAMLEALPITTTNSFVRKPTLHEDISLTTSVNTVNQSNAGALLDAINNPSIHESHRGESWYELFYDLVFVAAAIQIGSIIKSDVTLYNISQASLLFFILRLTWDNLMIYQNRFDTKDILHYGYYLVQAMCTFIMTLHLSIDESTHEWNPVENAGPIAIAAAIARLSNWLMYLHIYYHTAHFRQGFRKYILLIIITQFSSGILFIISSYNFKYRYTYLLLWFLCILLEKPILNISITILQKSMNRKGRIPHHFEHMVNRQSNFILLISGEAIIQLVQSSNGFTSYNYIRECLGFTTVYAVARVLSLVVNVYLSIYQGICYYQQNLICLKNPNCVKETPLGYLWEGIHLVLSLSILLFAVGIRLVNSESEGYRQISREYIMCVSASVSLVLIFMLRMIHKGFIYKLNEKSRILSYCGRFGISILMSFIPFMTSTSTQTIVALCILSMALVMQDTFSISKFAEPTTAEILGLVVDDSKPNSYTMDRILSGMRNRSKNNSNSFVIEDDLRRSLSYNINVLDVISEHKSSDENDGINDDIEGQSQHPLTKSLLRS